MRLFSRWRYFNLLVVGSLLTTMFLGATSASALDLSAPFPPESASRSATRVGLTTTRESTTTTAVCGETTSWAIDLGVCGSGDLGWPVVASQSGVVRESYRNSAYGHTVLIEGKSGLATRYAHLQSRSVSAGASVRLGQVIGRLGASGTGGGGSASNAHLHFAAYWNRGSGAGARIDRLAGQPACNRCWITSKTTTPRPPAPAPLSARAYAKRGLASGDFDGDGKLDLAVGAAGEDVGNIANAGGVAIRYGGTTPLQFLAQGHGLSGNPEAGDAVGAALASGDFDGDGYDDLAVGAPSEDVGNTSNAGLVNVIFGSAGGLETRSVFYHRAPG